MSFLCGGDLELSMHVVPGTMHTLALLTIFGRDWWLKEALVAVHGCKYFSECLYACYLKLYTLPRLP